MMRKFSLGIIQPRATQFDGPLFRRIAALPDLDLTVYFNKSTTPDIFHDPELGHTRQWDNDTLSGYRKIVSRGDVISQVKLLRIMLAANHDLIVVSGYREWLYIAIALAGKLRSIPVGIRTDNVLLYQKENSWKWRLKEATLPWFFKLYVTGHPTGTLARQYLRHYRFKDEALFLFPYNVDNDYLKSISSKIFAERDKSRANLGISPKDFVVLGILKFVPREDPMTLLRAYARLVKKCPDAHLILVGDGELRGSIEQLIAQEQLDKVHLAGFVSYSQLPRYLAISDVFVHPATRESWGVTVNEAMACGVPVITSDKVGSSADLITVGETGFVFRAGDHLALEDLLMKLRNDEKLRAKLSRNGSIRINEWSYEMTCRNLLMALQYVQAVRGTHSPQTDIHCSGEKKP
ncbi:MAG: glycosyltransferase [Oscillochloridaceae bacterium]|nr:glycosyltransferase [Chloroflexaceae bacterium]MDW8388728.1 glycosyltransferase [Oscillochloridaceae bacterium]